MISSPEAHKWKYYCLTSTLPSIFASEFSVFEPVELPLLLEFGAAVALTTWLLLATSRRRLVFNPNEPAVMFEDEVVTVDDCNDNK